MGETTSNLATVLTVDMRTVGVGRRGDREVVAAARSTAQVHQAGDRRHDLTCLYRLGEVHLVAC
jgi:hypothetical protein